MAEHAIDFAAGTVGGMAGVVAGQPFDTVKVYMQLGNGESGRGTIRCSMSSIYKQYGAKGFFKGMLSPMAGIAAMNATVFWGYGAAERYLRHKQGVGADEKTPLKDVYWAGFLGGLAQSFVCAPVELLKVRLQSFSDPSGAAGPVSLARHIVLKEGPLNLFRGLGVTILRDTPSFGLYFVVYEWIDRWMEHSSEVSRTLLAGGTAGVITWASVYPIDVIKSRIQTGREWNIREMWRSGALYRGALPCLIRAFPVNAVTFFVYNNTKKLLNHEFQEYL
mmetsp:Transcript_35954/g.93548  ORF Transcript_35954/g.93548 Transcript_35954/m.93548 type:complete len:277 (-) Transcript_35954:158-988(-)